ncbi:MAG: hypothetical protein MUO52_09650 [Desulfobacterales bacterium]|nr:hypothetical protein [Desulfobacterales bacterium]
MDSNFIIKNYFEPPVEFHFGEGGATLRQLLEKIGGLCAPVSFLEILGERDLGEGVDSLFLNGKNYFSLEKGLSTPLQDGDRVKLEIHIEPVDGG